jgi:hypothetical protein
VECRTHFSYVECRTHPSYTWILLDQPDTRVPRVGPIWHVGPMRSPTWHAGRTRRSDLTHGSHASVRPDTQVPRSDLTRGSHASVWPDTRVPRVGPTWRTGPHIGLTRISKINQAAQRLGIEPATSLHGWSTLNQQGKDKIVIEAHVIFFSI